MVRFSLRLTSDEHAALKDWATAEGRSLHGLLLWVLRRALREWR